jgi:protein-L-isoaspartate(D-aspartate) O-methyltransferase
VPSPEELQQAHERLISHLVEHERLRSKAVIEALRKVPRHLFVPQSLWSQAYFDTPLPIGFEQTISAPSIVAMMTELIEPGPDKTILEIGTGSGYQAAVLALLCKHVYTIEIIQPLAESAEKRLRELGYTNVTVRCGDGYRGWPEHAPFDGIMVTCAPTDIPAPLVEQLKEGGRMVIPVGPLGSQELYVLRKTGGIVERTAIIPVIFVPMTGEAQQRR